MDLKGTGCEGIDWVQMAKDRDQVAGCCEHVNKPLVSMKGKKFLDQLNDCQLLKKDCYPWNYLFQNNGLLF
jgi:hypothetical protein